MIDQLIPVSVLSSKRSKCEFKTDRKSMAALEKIDFEDDNKINFRADGFPEELVDNEPEEKGYEI